MTTLQEDWTAKSAKLTPLPEAWVHGVAGKAQNGESTTIINPATGDVLADVAACGPADAELAVGSARQAFAAGSWSRCSPQERKKILLRWADLIESQAEDFALLESLNVGKPISDCLSIDVPGAINTIRWSAEAIDKVYGEIAPTEQRTLALVQRLPLGVVLAIVPWNFPLSTTAWKLAPALAVGNSVILKPDPKTPLTALKLAALASEAGLPDGVLTVIPGDAQLGEYLCRHPDIDAQTFTGSTHVGKLLLQFSGQSNLKRTFLELGGKSANIVCADADLEKAAEWAAIAGFYNAGQTCTAGTRLLIQEQIYDEFLARVTHLANLWTPGHPLDPTTRMGPIINRVQCDKIQSLVDRGLADGARLLCGGTAIHGLNESLPGDFFPATLLADVDNRSHIAQEEIFGPVIAAMPFRTAEDAIHLANDSRYGLAGAVWSRDLTTALTIANEVRTGTMGVNNYFGGDMTVPFGGFKESGNGRDKSLHALQDYTELKTTWIEY